jgi:excisionase family DNA binding protein
LENSEGQIVSALSVEKPAGIVAGGLMTISEAAAFLSVSRSTVYVLMDNGSLPFTKIGGVRRVPRQALIKLAEKNLVGDGE